MSDEETTNPEEQLRHKHRREKKALQAEVQALKKSVPKGDRKKEKAAKSKIAEMEQSLSLRHAQELQMICSGNSDETDLSSQLSSVSVNNNGLAEDTKKLPGLSKAQKKRDKKAAKAREYSKLCEAAEMEYSKSARYQEEQAINAILSSMHLKVKQVKSDGDCLYSAVHDQLPDDDRLTVFELRVHTSEHIHRNKMDFIPFLTNQNGDQFTDDEFDKYCSEIQQQGVWGGQLELRALTHVLHTPIHIVQANTPTVILGEEYDTKPIILSYHRHELGLGEHYNSVTALNDADASNAFP